MILPIYKICSSVIYNSLFSDHKIQTTQTETIIRDSNGNEEKHIIHQKDGKKYTTVIRKDPSGTEQIERKVADIGDDTSRFETFLPHSHSDKNSENGYDFWFQRFFR